MSAPAPKGPPPIPMIPVDSTHVAAVGHDEKQRTLQVAFHDQSIYQYYGVSAPIAQAFMDSKSKGRYFNTQIKTKYKSACIAKPKPKPKGPPD